MRKNILLGKKKISLKSKPYIIAEVGSNSDGESILHFEIRLDGKPTDPLKVLPSR